MMPVEHIFSSGKGPHIDPNIVDGPNWNQDHDHAGFTIMGRQMGDDPRNTANPGAAVAEAYSSGAALRVSADLTYVEDVRVVANSDVNNNDVPYRLGVQYSLDQVAWDWLDGASGPYADMNPNGMKAGAWVSVTPAARTDVWLRWVTINGTGQTVQWMQHYLQGR